MENDFAVSVSEWVKKAKANGDLVFQQIALQALNRVRELTPVKTGYLKNSWNASLAGPGVPTATANMDSVEAIAQASLGDIITIYNPVSYARRIEFGFNGTDSLGRVFHQKGHHMMEQTIVEIPSIAQNVLNGLK